MTTRAPQTRSAFGVPSRAPFSALLGWPLLGLPLLAACGAPGATGAAGVDSRVDGHYEGKSEADMRRFSGGQVVPPEYAPVKAVLVSHALVREYDRGDFLRSLLAKGLRTLYVAVPSRDPWSGSDARTRVLQALGEHKEKVVFIEMETPSMAKPTVWARDWAPLSARAKDGSGARLLDFNYFPRRPVDDAVPAGLETSLPGFTRVSVPVYNEGGNFMNNGRGECVMTSRVTEANATRSHPDDVILDAAGVTDYYARFAGCRSTRIVPRMPHEGTGHIDMWAKFLTDDDVIVGRITRERIERFAGGARSREVASSVADYLDARASELTAAGYRVHRIPMPTPAADVFRSYTNSLLVNGTAYVPRYGSTEDASATGERWREEYEGEVVGLYERLGFRVEWVDSDALIRDGGAVHCVTMQFHDVP